jgi:phosphoglycerate kinase
MSHLGRPNGSPNSKYSLKPVVPELEKLLGKSVEFAPDCVGPEVEAIVSKADNGQVVLLENLRFHIEEEGSAKDKDGNKTKADKAKVEEFRKGLTSLGDIFISKFIPVYSYFWVCNYRRISNVDDYQTMPSVLPIVPTLPWLA